MESAYLTGTNSRFCDIVCQSVEGVKIIDNQWGGSNLAKACIFFATSTSLNRYPRDHTYSIGRHV